MEKIHILIVGESVKPFTSFARLKKFAGLESIKKEDLPVTAGRVRILEAEVDSKPF